VILATNYENILKFVKFMYITVVQYAILSQQLHVFAVWESLPL